MFRLKDDLLADFIIKEFLKAKTFITSNGFSMTFIRGNQSILAVYVNNQIDYTPEEIIKNLRYFTISNALCNLIKDEFVERVREIAYNEYDFVENEIIEDMWSYYIQVHYGSEDNYKKIEELLSEEVI